MRRFSSWAVSLLLAIFLAPLALAQTEEKKPPMAEGLPQRQVSEKERKRREEALRKELESQYKKWLEEDVVYILAPEEREAFLHLNTDEEREQFVEQFWLRRDPTPDTVENESREEHYRRIAYANERFSTGVPGWATDRGRIYIMHGPPDEIESQPAGGSYMRPEEEGGGFTSVYPFERWRYRYLEGVGQEVVLEFVDTTMTNEYRLTYDPSEKDALLHVPGAGLSRLEAMGLASKTERFNRTDGTNLPRRLGTDVARFEGFERLETYANVQKPPPIKFKDLEALVTTRISFNLLPFDLRLDYLRVTEDTTLIPITIALKKKDLSFKLQQGMHQSVVNVFGRVSTLSGRVVQTFEDVIRLDVPPDLLPVTLEQRAVYQKAVPLRPGLYKLNLVLKDLNSGNVGTMEERLAVPRFEEDQLAHSSLILADVLEGVASKNVGSGQFVVGDTRVRPAVGEGFRRSQPLGIYLQVYNLGINEQTHKPEATIAYTIRKGEKTILAQTETTAQMERAGQQLTLEKILPLGKFAPGEYTVDIKITDHIRQQSVSPSARFRVTE